MILESLLSFLLLYDIRCLLYTLKYICTLHCLSVWSCTSKYAVCFTRSIEDTARAGSLAKYLADGTIDDFWGNVRKMNSGKAIEANTIDGFSGEGDIAVFCGNHFSKLLNANNNDATLKTSLLSKFNKVLYCNDMIIPSSLISEATKKLECDKSAFPDGVNAESIKFAHPSIYALLFVCFSLCFTHGYIYICLHI